MMQGSILKEVNQRIDKTKLLPDILEINVKQIQKESFNQSSWINLSLKSM
jgi:hypothetical protein